MFEYKNKIKNMFANIFHKKNSVNKNFIFISLISVFTVMLLLVNFVFLAQARQSDSTVDTNCVTGTQPYCIDKVPKNATKIYSLYFRYGNSTNTSSVDLYKAIAKISIDNPSMEFVSSDIYDIYNTSTTTSTPPASIDQCNSSTVPKYKINPSLISTNQILYGLQSANNTTAGSGAATVEKLTAKNTGCVQVNLKVSTQAVENAVVTITFDEDYGQSGAGAVQLNLTDPYYVDASRPGLQKVSFTIGANSAAISSSSVSSSSVKSSSSSSSSSSVPVASAVVTTPPRSGGPAYLALGSLLALFAIILIAKNTNKNRISEKQIK